jgi:hypothetical protein
LVHTAEAKVPIEKRQWMACPIAWRQSLLNHAQYLEKTIAKEVPCPRKVIDTKQIKANAIDFDRIAINNPGTARKVFSV